MQKTTNIYTIEKKQKVKAHVCVSASLTVAHWSLSRPHSTCSTHSTVSTTWSVSSVTGVGSSHHEGGSRGCVHCSIGWII